MTTDTRKLGDSFAVAILQWPAVIGAITLGGEGWELGVRIVLGVWAALVSLGLIFGRSQGPRWGLAMTLCAGLAAGFWLSVPDLWALLWFVALATAFHAALRARLDEPEALTTADADAQSSL